MFNRKILSFAAFVTPVYILGASTAFAQQGVGQLLTNIRSDTLGPLVDFAGALAFVLGIILWIIAAYRVISARNDGGIQQTGGLAGVIMFAIAGTLLVAIPTLAGVGVTTIFGSGADTGSIDGSLRSIR